MRAVFRTALAIGACLAGAAQAQVVTPDGVIVLPQGSSVYNQNSVQLPTMTTPYGQDEVHGAGGVSCRSSVASGGAYVDFGMIGTNDLYDRQAASLYGRVVVPLGKRPERLDCQRLYELEIQRLQMELEMARMGLGMMVPPESAPPMPSPAPQGLSMAPAQDGGQNAVPPGAVVVGAASPETPTDIATAQAHLDGPPPAILR